MRRDIGVRYLVIDFLAVTESRRPSDFLDQAHYYDWRDPRNG